MKDENFVQTSVNQEKELKPVQVSEIQRAGQEAGKTADYQNASKIPNQVNQQDAQKKRNVKTIVIAVVVIQILLSVLAGAYFFKKAYQNAKTNTTNRIRQSAYDTVYDITEGANHASNRASIYLDQIREKADLEVLQVGTNYLYISDEEDRAKNLTIWYEIPGTGTFTVDLTMTEFIVDHERHHVLVKAPLPTITIFREEIDKIQKLEYQDDKPIPDLQGSIQTGETIARKMLDQAHVEMMRELTSNNDYLDAAKDSAQKLITNIIKAINSSISDLTVTVEFNENM